MEEVVVDTEGGGAAPNGGDVEEGEDNGPDQGQGKRDERGQDSVEPEAGEIKEEKSESPDKFKALV
jgi:hypothetical protein